MSSWRLLITEQPLNMELLWLKHIFLDPKQRLYKAVCLRRRTGAGFWFAFGAERADMIAVEEQAYIMVVLHDPHRQLLVQPLQRHAAHGDTDQR